MIIRNWRRMAGMPVAFVAGALAVAGALSAQEGGKPSRPVEIRYEEDPEGESPAAAPAVRLAQVPEDLSVPEPVAPDPPPAPPRPPAPLGSRLAALRLARAPFMFGDQPPFTNGPTFEQEPDLRVPPPDEPMIPIEPSEVFVDTGRLPLAAAGRRFRVAENNSPFPQNRVFFVYNHFHNLFRAQSFTPPARQRTSSLDRYTLGVEQTFGEGLWSLDVRLPFLGGHSIAAGDFTADGSRLGNVNVAVKRLLYQSDDTALSAGLGVNTPTGGDVTGRLGDARYRLHNDSVHLNPFVGWMETPTDRWFVMAFAQLDIDLNGNRLAFDDGAGRRRVGTLNDQTLLYLDLSSGYWLYRDLSAPRITGLATVLELHYTTALQNADSVAVVNRQTGDRFTFGNSANRFDVLNFVVGLHTEIARLSSVRVGGVFPLRTGDNRWFDAEVQVSLNIGY